LATGLEKNDTKAKVEPAPEEKVAQRPVSDKAEPSSEQTRKDEASLQGEILEDETHLSGNLRSAYVSILVSGRLTEDNLQRFLIDFHEQVASRDPVPHTVNIYAFTSREKFKQGYTAFIAAMQTGVRNKPLFRFDQKQVEFGRGDTTVVVRNGSASQGTDASQPAGTYRPGQTYYVGPRGGVYHLSSNGNKEYVRGKC